MPSLTGHCLCGAITFRADAPPKLMLHCHCESCRRAAASPMTTWLSVPVSAFSWTKGEPRVFASSPGVRRSFCGGCGSPLAYENAKLPGEIHLYAALLDDPDAVEPLRHVFCAEQLPWLEILDEPPRYATTSASGAAPLRSGPRKS
jgi:hypothetical protein